MLECELDENAGDSSANKIITRQTSTLDLNPEMVTLKFKQGYKVITILLLLIKRHFQTKGSDPDAHLRMLCTTFLPLKAPVKSSLP